MSKSIEVLESELRYALEVSGQMEREFEALQRRQDELAKQLLANDRIIQDLKDGLEAVKQCFISDEVRESFIITDDNKNP